MRRICRVFSTRTIKFSDLGKDFPKLPPLPPLDMPKAQKGGSMMNYIDSVMQKYPDAVVMTQVGGFYEMYFENALEFGPKLEFKIAQKRQYNPRTGQNWIPMIGFPLSQVAKYTQLLVRDWDKNVVVLAQQQEHILGKSSEELKRPIARIITPGTIVDDELIDSFQHNYIACISVGESDKVAIAWVDLADSSIYYQLTTKTAAIDELVRLSPREVIVNKSSDYSFIDLSGFHTSQFTFPLRDALIQYRIMIDHPEKSLRHIVDRMDSNTVAATGALLAYINEALPGALHKYSAPKKYQNDEFVKLDRSTIQALELFWTEVRDEAEGSLFWVIRRTITASGSRLLQKTLSNPTRNKMLIESRLDMVELFYKNENLRLGCRTILHNMPDAKRVIHRLGSTKVDTKELLKYVTFVDCVERCIPELKELLPEWSEFLDAAFGPLAKIRAKIRRQVNISKTEPSKYFRSFNFHLFPHATPAFNVLCTSREKLAERFEEYNTKYKDHYKDIGKASLRYSPQLGYHCVLKFKGPPPTLSEDAELLTQSLFTKCFSTKEILDLGHEYETCLHSLEAAQTRILGKLRGLVLDLRASALDCIEIIDKLDLFQGLATLAVDCNLCRPELVDGPTLEIVGGRNLVVESGLHVDGGSFTANDTYMSARKPMYMITGPNMGGKSTYIRQVAIICLLAQIGSFVPAEKAALGMVDRIFCRIGSGDDITRGRSTFMMEMLETAEILRSATVNSLAILDEVGRGTSEKDGVAIAYGVMRHILEENKCRSLFTTHYGPYLQKGLSDAKLDEKVTFMRTIPVFGGKFINYNHKLIPGVCDDAHGLEMARLAGFPEDAMEIVQGVYDELE